MTRRTIALVDLESAATAAAEAALRPTFEVAVTPVANLPRRLAGGDVGALVLCAGSVGSALTDLVRTTRSDNPLLPILVITRVEGPQRLIELLRAGIDDFVTDPFAAADLVPRVWRLAGSDGRRAPGLTERVALHRLVGTSASFVAVVERIPLVARCDSTVLISGETGTGKEMVSRAIHYLSPRARRPFVPVNCGAIPTELVENELFGHQRSAYTGADSSQEGLIAEAEGGTLLLDEVDCLPPSAQVKLLRFLQQREYRPLGSPRTRTADVRVLAATNADVGRAVERGQLRRDLYYRLNVLPLELPPLRQRREDIPLLARHFLAQHAQALRQPCPALGPGTERALVARDWPGNVRELQHVMERALVFAGSRGQIRCSDMLLPEAEGNESFKEAKAKAVARFERGYLQEMLATYRGNITQASRAAKKNRRAFFELIRKHGIDVDRFRRPRTS